MISPVPLRSLKRTYFFSAVSAVIGIVYPIVTLAYVARVLGPGALGKYYFAFSLASYFLFAASLGIPLYGIREIGAARGNLPELRRIFSQLFFINSFSSIFFALVYGIVVLSVPNFRAEIALLGIFGLLFLNNIFNFDYLYAGLERQDQIAYRSLISKLASMALIFALVRNEGDYLWFAGITVFSLVINSALALNGLKYWAGLKEIAKTSSLRRHIRPILLIALSTAFINVYINLDSVILGLMRKPHEVGLYNAAVKPCRLIAALLSTVLIAALPRLSYYVAGGVEVHVQQNLKRRSLELLLMFAIPISLTLAVSAGPLVQLMYGPEFSEAAPSLVLASPLLLLNCLAAFHLFQVVIPLGKEVFLVYVAMAGAIISVALNLILIPILGYQGAVIAALIAEVATIVISVILIRSEGRDFLVFPKQVWKHLVAGGLLALVQILLLPATHGSLPLLAAMWVASAAVYGVSLWFMRETLVLQVSDRLVEYLKPRRL